MPENVLSSHVIGAVSDTDDAQYSSRLEADARSRRLGIYPRTIFIGLGGTGAKALMHLRRLIIERFGALDNLQGVAFLSIDTDVHSQQPSAEEKKQNPLAAMIGFDRDERINLKVDFKGLVGPNIINHPEIREWWDEAALPSQEFNLESGAGQIRPLARLALFSNCDEIGEGISRAYRNVSSNRINSNRVDSASKVRVVVVTGIAGGTGSGIFLDLAALVQQQLGPHERPDLEAYLVLPGGFSTVEEGATYPKVAANGFAALREISHYLSHPFEVQWSPTSHPYVARGLYDRYVLFSGTNASNEHLSDLGDCYLAIGEILFLEFGAGGMAGWIEGVRVNREQYMRETVTHSYRLSRPDGSTHETHADQWRSAFSSVGLSKLVFPSWRLINRAKYELAAQMVALMDPGRVSRVADILNTHRDRFLFDCGILQGERLTDQGRQSFAQVKDRLARQVQTANAASSVFEHIQRFQDELDSLAESMYSEGNTAEAGNELWGKLVRLWGDPYAPGREGDWPKQIFENRKALATEVHRVLPEVIENFRCLPAVGISGVMALVQECIDLLGRDATQARYADWFRQQRPVLTKRIEAAEALWKRRLQTAQRASEGFGRSPGNHRAALHLAGEALGDCWRARANEYIASQAPEALAAIVDSLRERLSVLQRIADRMSALESEYRLLAQFYSTPQRSFIVHEMAGAANLEDLLGDYLGRQAVEREDCLRRLLDRGLVQMGLTTLEAIGSKLFGAYESFRDNLAAQAFYALRGENGETEAFSANPDEKKQAFIERYSIFRVLKEACNEAQRRDLFDQLYRKGLPWAQKNSVAAIEQPPKPKGDAFVGYTEAATNAVPEEMMKHLQEIAREPFRPKAVGAFDPSEIIFYSELTAFPVYYLSEITDLERHYKALLQNNRIVTPLHIHQDYHQFQPLVPYDQSMLASFRVVWKVFVEAEILGLVRSVRLRAGDDQRIVFQWRHRISRANVQWSDLGSEGRAIERLMNDITTRSKLQSDLETERQRLRSLTPQSYSYLAALADYYFYCIFPERRPAGGGQSPIEALGSMQNLVTDELRREWRSQQMQVRGGTTAAAVEDEIETLLRTLAEWSKPVYRDVGQPLPATAALPETDRIEEWSLFEEARKAVDAFIGKGVLLTTRDALGSLVLSFPRLRIDWDYFEKVEQPPQDSWFYAGGDGTQESGLTAAQVAERVARSLQDGGKVFRPGMDNWREVREVPEIARLLGGAATPAGEPSAAAAAPGLAKTGAAGGAEMPPPLGGTPPPAPAGPIYHYACDDQNFGKLSVEEIVRRISISPERRHQVWQKEFGKIWKGALDVPEIANLLADQPPPLV